MPTRRSLCDLAGQVMLNDDAAAAHNKYSQVLPACGACLIIADTLSRSAKALASSRGVIEPSTAATAVNQLRTTHWQWALTPDAFDRLQDADYPGKETK